MKINYKRLNNIIATGGFNLLKLSNIFKLTEILNILVGLINYTFISTYGKTIRKIIQGNLQKFLNTKIMKN